MDKYKRKFLIKTIFSVVVVIFAFYVVGIAFLSAVYFKTRDQHAVLYLDTVSDLFIDFIRDNIVKSKSDFLKVEYVQSILKGFITRHPKIKVGGIIDPDGRIIFHSIPYLVGENFSNITHEDVEKLKRKYFEKRSLKRLGYRLIVINRPIYDDNGNFCGALRLGLSLDNSKKNFFLFLLEISLFVFSLSAALLAYLVFFIDKHIARPMKYISRVLDIDFRDFNLHELEDVCLKIKKELGFNLSLVGVLKELKEEYEKIYDLISSAIFTVDISGRIVSWNKNAEKITGYGREEVIGRKCGFFMKNPCDKRCSAFDENIPKPVKGEEVFFITKNGEERIGRKNVDILCNNSGELVGAVEILDDITDYKNDKKILEEEMAKINLFNDIALEREEKILELKKRVNELSIKLGEKPPYNIIETDE